jgi:hypothetical protein
MKQLSIIAISMLASFLFSCSDSTKEKPQKEDIKSVMEEKVDSEPQLIVKEDAIIEAPDVRKDTSPAIGILKTIEESDFWGRVYLYVEVDGKTKSFPYYGEAGTENFGDFEYVENLIGKKVSIKFRIEETLEEEDLHVENKTIHGKYGSIKTEEQIKENSNNKIDGTLLVNEYDKSGDLPSDYRIIDNNGDTITISGFVYDTHVALNGKKATVYYFEETTYIATSVISLEKEELNTSAIFIGKWKKEESSNPMDPTSFEIKKKNESDYTIKFSGEDYFVSAIELSDILKGQSSSGKFEIDIVSKNPPIISYSDDGRGHFEPNRNIRFVKVKPNAELLVDN